MRKATTKVRGAATLNAGAEPERVVPFEAIVGSEERIKNLARDIVTHFEKRQTGFEGKAMIVAMSRRIAADITKRLLHFALTGIMVKCRKE